MAEKVKCIVCNEPATVFLSLLMGSRLAKAAYCQKHAEEVGVFEKHGYEFLTPPQDKKSESGRLSDPSLLRCTACGFTQHHFEKYGKLGCSACYETFSDVLKPLLRKIHAGPTHLGKISRKAMAKPLLDDRIKYLETQLQQAVANECYEDAAQFRDKISEMRQFVTEAQN